MKVASNFGINTVSRNGSYFFCSQEENSKILKFHVDISSKHLPLLTLYHLKASKLNNRHRCLLEEIWK